MTKRRVVIITETARLDLSDIYCWIRSEAGWNTAGRYIERLEKFCLSLDLASERGSARPDLATGLRMINFEKRLTIAFTVSDDRVGILRIFRAGRNWEAEFSDD